MMIAEETVQEFRAPLSLHANDCVFELTYVDERSLTGRFQQRKTHHRFEVQVRYEDGSSERFSVCARGSAYDGIRDGVPEPGTFQITLRDIYQSVDFKFKNNAELDFRLSDDGMISALRGITGEQKQTQILFDVSDLVYYIGHHDNLTGIQRVQACVLMGMIEACPDQARGYITFNNRTRDFIVIESTYFESLLRDLSLPVTARRLKYDRMDARVGILPNSLPLASALASSADHQLIVYLLGAAWVNRDYFNRILELKRTLGALFCMTVHDLIPIYARETCDQGTAVVFEEFLRKSFLFTDHYYAVSENTGLDLIRFARTLDISNVPVSVVENGHALDEFFPFKGRKARAPVQSEYVLFVSTIEGRKNHSYIFDVWAQLSKTLSAVPTLVCVGRFGWRAEQFLEKMLVTNNLENKIRVLSDISDSELETLYDNCLFTVYPSTYEGWGLPVGESISKGKLCVISDRSSLPEVAGEFGIYVDLDSVRDGVEKIARLIEDPEYRTTLEKRMARDFVTRTWKRVAADLVRHLAELPVPAETTFPLLSVGREYKLSQLPPRNMSALGHAMIAEVNSARRGPITGYVNRDEDLLSAQAMRSGGNWYTPEDWGTWSRYPECVKLFYIRTSPGTTEVTIYERLRVVSTIIGATLRVTVNGGAVQSFAVEEERMIVRIVCPVRANMSGVAEIRIRYELSQIGDRLAELDRIDGRRLGIGFESSAIIDDADLGARISMLERLLFGGGSGGIAAQQRERFGSTMEVRSGTSGRKAARSLLVKAQAGAIVVDSGDERSLNSPLLEVGETLLVNPNAVTKDGVPIEQTLGRGWFALEQGGIWSMGAEATLHFRLEREHSSIFAIVLDIRCLAAADRPVRISIIVNGVIIGTSDFRDAEYRTVRYVVDEKACPEDRAFVVLLHCDRPVSPVELGGSTDTRELGLHLRSYGTCELPRLLTGHEYPVSAASNSVGLFSDGWYAAEEGGIWSTAEGGRIVGAFHEMSSAGQASVKVTLTGRVFGTEHTGQASVDLVVQGQVMGTWTFLDDAICTQQGILPLLRLQDCALLDVRFVRKGAISPVEAGDGLDRRKLGLHVDVLAFDGATIADFGRKSAQSANPKEN